MSIDERIADRVSVLCSARSSNAHEYDLCVRAVRAALADPVLRGWRPIESAPRDGTEIIVGFDVATVWIVHVAWYRDGSPESGADGPEDIGWWSYVRNCVSQEMLDDIYTPTHWMPLLKPPEVK